VTRRIEGEPAYVLHLRPYRESSALVELLTVHHGCISVVGRGMRQRRGRSIPVPFVRLRVGCSGRSALLSLTGFETERRIDLEGRALFSGLYLNELVLRLIRHDDPHAEVFAGYEAALESLAAGADVEGGLRRFEKLLLKESGYELTLEFDAESGEPVEPLRSYRFVPDIGVTAVEEPADERQIFSGAVLRAIAADDYRDITVRRAAKRIMRRALDPHLGDRPLASRTLFRREGT